jgi:hypothetical protein
MERIDVHSHFLPPFYREELEKTGHHKPDGMPGIPVCRTNPLNKVGHLKIGVGLES